MNTREYRLLRQRHRAAQIEANLKGNPPCTEAERLIALARMWAPFGGASGEDTLVHFGLTPHRFIDRLWQAVAEGCVHEDGVRAGDRKYRRVVTRRWAVIA